MGRPTPRDPFVFGEDTVSAKDFGLGEEGGGGIVREISSEGKDEEEEGREEGSRGAGGP